MGADGLWLLARCSQSAVIGVYVIIFGLGKLIPAPGFW
jgi:hypothetical protein